MSIFHTLNTNSAHVADIKNTMSSVIADLTASAADIKASKDALDAEREADSATRETMLRRMAELSINSQWSSKDIETGIGDAVAALSSKDNKLPASIKTFTDECKAVMMPGLRQHFADIMDAAVSVWIAETEARKELKDKADTPARKAWKRRYHTITMCARALPEHGLLLDTPELVTQYAVFKDPDMDAGKVLKQIETALAALEVIKNNFPDANVEAAARMLGGVTKDTLERARASALDAATTVTQPAAPAPAPSTTVIETTPLPTPVPATSAALTILGGAATPIAGAFDPFAAAA